MGVRPSHRFVEDTIAQRECELRNDLAVAPGYPLYQYCEPSQLLFERIGTGSRRLD